jgi:hypothetical protein
MSNAKGIRRKSVSLPSNISKRIKISEASLIARLEFRSTTKAYGQDGGKSPLILNLSSVTSLRLLHTWCLFYKQAVGLPNTKIKTKFVVVLKVIHVLMSILYFLYTICQTPTCFFLS